VSAKALVYHVSTGRRPLNRLPGAQPVRKWSPKPLPHGSRLCTRAEIRTFANEPRPSGSGFPCVPRLPRFGGPASPSARHGRPAAHRHAGILHFAIFRYGNRNPRAGSADFQIRPGPPYSGPPFGCNIVAGLSETPEIHWYAGGKTGQRTGPQSLSCLAGHFLSYGDCPLNWRLVVSPGFGVPGACLWFRSVLIGMRPEFRPWGHDGEHNDRASGAC
jgi:hypothetical protein